MRLCFISDGNSPYVLALVDTFANQRGHDVHLISLREVRNRMDGVRTYDLGCRSKLGYLLRIPRVRRLVARIKPDVLIGYRIQSYGFVAACSGFHPLVLVPQCASVAWPPNSRLMSWFCRFAIQRADWINSLGEHMTQSLLRLGASPNIIDTYPAGVRAEWFFPATEPVESADRTIITTRCLAPEYHQDLVIKAVCRIRRQYGKDIHYIVVGDGSQRVALESLVRQLEVEENVQFVGYHQAKEVGQLLRKASVYVSLVSTDGVSASLLEAMACGVFPIVPDIPANRLWINDRVNGFLLSTSGWQKDRIKGFYLPTDQGAELAEKIVTALGDAELRARAREINVVLVQQKADWAINSVRMEKTYKELAKSSGPVEARAVR